jgi:SPP1 gp7 family putative phage head morphogenesis protein
MKVQPTTPSPAIEAKYALVLRDVTSAFSAATERAVKKILKNYTPATEGTMDAEIDPRRAKEATFRLVETMYDRIQQAASNIAAQAVTAGATFNREQFIATIKQGIGVDIRTVVESQNLRPVLLRRIKKNTDLIKSLPQEHIDRVKKVLEEGITKGDDAASILATVREASEITDRRAKLIARDQMAKLNGDLTQARQIALGIDSYIWRTSRDARVRDDHRDREGNVYQWDKPPSDGHPGQPVQCRCTAEPNIRGALGV